MECNKDEALRAKSIAEDKLEKEDFDGAKKFAIKAQALYPALDGISQLLTTLDVYVSGENKISGEIDWYGVLRVSPSTDDDTIRKQYRKLALILHPDKNKSVGADGAFKLISEAWGLLSDKANRLAYNQRRGSRGFQQKVHEISTNGIFNFARTTSKTQNNTAKPPPKPTPTSFSQRKDTFWTICHQCKMHYEYLKMYLNSTLFCHNCRDAFMATGTPPPFNFSKSSTQVPRQRQHTSSARPSQPAYDLGINVPVAQKSGTSMAGPLSGIEGVGGTDPSIAEKAANVVQQAHVKLKRAYTESHASTGWDGCAQKRKLDDDNNQYGIHYNVARGNGGFGVASGSAPGSRDLTLIETRNMLIAKARKEIQNKLHLWRSETTVKAADKERHRSAGNIIQGHDQNGNGDFTATKLTDQPGKGHENSHFDDNSSKEVPEAASMNVPDPDFHDFDQDTTESCFGDNEVWSAYDDDDGMPRFYALINKVISRNPFKLRIRWLNSKTTSEFSTLDWVGSGFYKTCGEFRVGKYEICKSMNAFSQKVTWSKGPRGSILIVPQKGDVWAIYKNWSSDWNEHTPDEVIHKYEMVKVVEDYNKEHGVCVAPLVKVVGFKTIFRPNLDQEAMKKIPKEEMFRFSHRVPNHLLTGLEAQNAPKGCLELDPAATSLELLQVVTKGDDQVLVVPADTANATEELLQSVPNSNVNEIAN